MSEYRCRQLHLALTWCRARRHKRLARDSWPWGAQYPSSFQYHYHSSRTFLRRYEDLTDAIWSTSQNRTWTLHQVRNW